MTWLRPRWHAREADHKPSRARWGEVGSGRRQHTAGRRGGDPAGMRLRWEVGALVVGVGIWELVGGTHPLLLATPGQVWSAGVKLSSSGALWRELWVTLAFLLIGFAVAMAAGVLLGLLMGLSRAVARIAGMYLYWMLSAPEAALIPFIVVLLGYGTVARFVVVLLFALPVIANQTMEGVVSIPAGVLDMSRSFEVSGWRRLTRVIVPGALPAVMIAARLGLARSLLGVITGGILMEQFGLGGQIFFYQQAFQLAPMLLYLLTVIVLGLVLTRLIQLLDHRIMRWRTGIATA